MESDGFDDFVTIEKEDAENMENNDNDFLDENIEEDDYEGTFISVSMPNPIKKVDLVKTSAIFETKNNFSLLNSIKSMASSIYYNHFNSSDKFDLENPKYINNTDCIIFSKKLKNRTIAQKTITSSIIRLIAIAALSLLRIGMYSLILSIIINLVYTTYLYYKVLKKTLIF